MSREGTLSKYEDCWEDLRLQDPEKADPQAEDPTNQFLPLYNEKHLLSRTDGTEQHRFSALRKMPCSEHSSLLDLGKPSHAP